MAASKRPATPAAAAAPAAAPKSAQPPKGMKPLEGGYAKTWNVEEEPILQGTVSAAPKSVTLNKGTKKEAERQCVEVRTAEGDRYTLWASAGLTPLFDKLGDSGTKYPIKVWVAFKGLGTAKKGQNAPKLFDVAVG